MDSSFMDSESECCSVSWAKQDFAELLADDERWTITQFHLAIWAGEQKETKKAKRVWQRKPDDPKLVSKFYTCKAPCDTAGCDECNSAELLELDPSRFGLL
jgi:hypothetical protein